MSDEDQTPNGAAPFDRLQGEPGGVPPASAGWRTRRWLLIAVPALVLAVAAVVVLVFRLLGRGEACPDAVPWDVARTRVGELLVIRGDVVGTFRDPESETVILDLGLPAPDPERLSLVLVESALSFDPVERFSGEAVCVRGTVEAADEVAYILIGDESDLWLDERRFRTMGSGSESEVRPGSDWGRRARH
jgi:hypothetical protein